MTDETKKSNESSDPRASSPPALRSSPWIYKYAAPAAVLVAVVGGLYKTGVLNGLAGGGHGKSPKAVFYKVDDERLFASEGLLKSAGAGLLTPRTRGKVAERALLDEIQKSPEYCAAKNTLGQEPATVLTAEPSAPIKAISKNSAKPQALTAAKGKNDAEELPKPTTVASDEAKNTQETPENEVSEQADGSKESTPERDEVSVAKGHGRHIETPVGATAALTKTPSPAEPNTRPDEFRLPGSVTVNMRGYSGAVLKWGLMVIYDTSSAMGKKVRSWNTTRSRVAESIILKLPNAVTPGSRVAVRDFQCGKGDVGKRCPTRMLFPWGDAPFAELKDKLSHAKAAGKNNACAAAAYSLKKDFVNSGTLTPRILIITEGLSKCVYSEVLQAIEEHKEKNRIIIDVLFLGARKKKQDGYAAIVKRTGGVVMHIHGPHELDRTMKNYAKLLKAKTMEKIEIRGERIVYNTPPEEETTLAPGSYNIILPLVVGLHSSNRTIHNVKIAPGEARVLDVRIKKGRLILR